MLFAIVDIETTGGHAAGAGITEIAIIISDGVHILDRWQSLINPLRPIPSFIQQLTGISNSMVEGAPHFAELAGHIHALLQDKIFVAHNVNFDYSFVRYQLAHCGLELHNRKLCTLRLARKVFPGLSRYSLGQLCHALGIQHENRHRAYGDAAATAILFSKLIAADTEGHWAAMIKGRNREQYLPPNLPVEQLDNLPEKPGVYYFYNAKGKVIYVGKARNLFKRVKSHFANNKASRQKANFLLEIHGLSFRLTATDLMAQILESTEIRKLWPIHNHSQRGYHPQYALYSYEDRQGYLHLGIERYNPRLACLYSFNTISEGQDLIRMLCTEFRLCLRLCGLANGADCAQGKFAEGCQGQCCSPEGPTSYNEQVSLAIHWIAESLPSLVLIDQGREPGEQSCILMEAGEFKGMGYFKTTATPADWNGFLEVIEPMPDNDFIRGLILRTAKNFPEKCQFPNRSPEPD